MTKVRLTAAERGEEVLQAAVQAFGASGYEGTKTDEIARLAGVSQPYVIRLFGTKQELFLASVRYVCARVEQVFREAAAEAPDLAHLARGYEQMSEERELLLVLLQGFSASANPAIGECTREGFGSIYRLIRELTGATAVEAREFLSTGMLLTVLTAMQVMGPDARPAAWADELKATFTVNTD
ncbi:TetR/AcrR family transcriptional regulator [Kribbella sp. NPDC058245]|uniref:TetR/AcrR family transcriptional regulator n=1 Tax=Kribbella sp. NPDC058245 TaxID=3346399 RepID=UPI0036EFF6EA